MRKLLLLVALSLVVALVFATAAVAQQEEGGSGGSASGGSGQEGQGSGSGRVEVQREATIIQDEESTEPLPQSGGMTPSTFLPAAALILGSGILAFAVLRRR